jgi:GxxExxY protein
MPTFGLMAEAQAISARIIAAIIRVHQTLGPGFIEIIYRRALAIEMRKDGLEVQAEVLIPIYYDGIQIGRHRLDLLVEKQVIVEVKTVEGLGRASYAQVRSYLKATGLDHAFLVNFAGVRADFRRVDLAGSAYTAIKGKGDIGDVGDVSTDE